MRGWANSQLWIWWWLSWSPASSPVSIPLGQALRYPSEVQGQLSHLPQLARDEERVMGPVLPRSHPRGWLTCTPDTRVNCVTLQSSGVLQPVRGSFAQPLDINTIPGGSPDQGCPHDAVVVIGVTDTNRDPDPVLSSSMGWGFAMAPGGRAGYSHQAVPPHPHVSRSVFLHDTQTVSVLSLSHLSTLYLHMVVDHTRPLLMFVFESFS